jgi:hypothetical protein
LYSAIQSAISASSAGAHSQVAFQPGVAESAVAQRITR